MRYVFLGFTAILLFVTIISREPAPTEAEARTAAASSWRRTVHGWEPLENLLPPIHPQPVHVPIHPASLAALQVLVSLGALLTFEARLVRQEAAAT